LYPFVRARDCTGVIAIRAAQRIVGLFATKWCA
jgi:hypothetical protein